jgi:autotransporter-associated beta strand protein
MKARILNTARLSFPLATAIAALHGLFATPAAHAAARTWSGGSGDWETGQTGGFATGPWANSDTATFSGPGGTVTVQSAITTANAALVFSAGNYTLQSDVATERVVTLGNDNVTLGNGVTTTIGSNVTLSRAAALTFDGNSTATSTLNINSGGRATNSGAAITIKEATANVNTGGTIQSDSSLVVGNTTDGAILNVLGGTVTVGIGNAGAIFALGNTATLSPTVNFKITGGSLGFTDAGDSLAHSLRVGPLNPGSGVVTATIDLEGGVVAVRGIYENKSTYSSTLNLHGGTLKALTTTTDYIRVDNVWIKSGGAIFDSNGQSVTVTKDLLTDVFSTGGGLTLNDSAITKGTLTLSGALITYTGPTLVSAGKLVMPSTHAGTGAATVSANATLGVTVSGTSQWQPASLSLADPCTLEFNNVQNPGTTTAPLLPGTAVGTVTNVTININSIAGAATPGNSYPLLGNQGGTTNDYTLGTDPAGVTGHLAVSGTTLVYVVDSSADVWTGADLTNLTGWDIATTTNWTGKALINTPAGSYAEGDNVRFDDTATPASPVTVEIQAPVAPGNMTFANSSKNYIVNGSFAIGGSGTLTKTGSGTLTLSSSNSYSGGTNVSGKGALALAHGSAAGSGTINFASTSTSATIPTFSLSGGIDVTNAMILRADTGRNTIHSLGDNNTLSGNLTITNNAANIVLLSNYAAVGTTFTVGGATPNSTAITADTFSNSISFRCQTSGALGILNSRINAPNATVDANVNGNWTINSTGNSWAVTALLNGGIIKLGANDSLATGAVVNLDGTGYVDLNGFNQTVTGLAGSGSTGKIVNHSTTSDSILTLAGLTADRNFIGAITDGTNGRITSLVMNSSGRTQTLSGTNTYTGNTTITAGTLTLSNAPDPLNANTANDASTITIASTGATLDLTFTGTDKVDKLVIGSTQQADGVYGKVGSALPVIGISQITGDGTLTVGDGTPAGFSSWITGTFANGTVPGGQQGPNDDFDKDGISNLVEYAVAGQDPTVPNATVGTFNAGTLSFSKRLDATGITYDIESSTLLTAESWTTLAKPSVVEIAGSISYTFTLGTPVKNFIRLKVTTAP